VSSKLSEHPRFHPQEVSYVQFCGIFFMYQYKQSGRWQDGPVGSYYTGTEISLMKQAC
jgi:hypothetical protein